MNEISAKWTEFERLALMNRLKARLATHTHVTTEGYKYDLRKRIEFLRIMPAEFLECNRAAIINGNVIPIRGCFGRPK